LDAEVGTIRGSGALQCLPRRFEMLGIDVQATHSRPGKGSSRRDQERSKAASWFDDDVRFDSFALQQRANVNRQAQRGLKIAKLNFGCVLCGSSYQTEHDVF
jgi:hypothetical protein